MKQIYVQNKDLGFWTQEEIPVTRKEQTEGGHIITWCNHASPELVEQNNQVNNIDFPDIEWTDKVLVCRKCGAYKVIGINDFWEDAPEFGVIE